MADSLTEHLDAALEADDAHEREFHVRQAAQLFEARRARSRGELA